MTLYAYESTPDTARPLGLVVLQSDETIEMDFRRMLAPEVPLYVSRVPSDTEVTPDTLQSMAGHLTASAALFPTPLHFASVGYGCTSGTAQIGPDRIAALVKEGTRTDHVTNPLSALVAACAALGVTRLAFLSPYVADVSGRLRSALAERGIASPTFGSFNEGNESKVVRIAGTSIIAAAQDLASGADVQAVFLSCTNLRTLNVIDQIEAQTGLPCLSSNQVLAWHMARLAGISAAVPGRLGHIA